MWTPGGQIDFLSFAGLRGGGSSGTSTSISQTILPDWVNTASTSNYAQAAAVADRDYQANPYSSVAGTTADQQAAYQRIRDLQGTTDPAYNQAQAASSGLLSQATPLTAGQISGTAQQLMNPYQLAVVAPTVQQMRESLAQEQAKTGAQASNVGAFGGSRLGIEQGTAAAQEALGEGKLVGGLLQSGYDTASQQAMDLAKQNFAAGQNQITLLPQLASAQSKQAATEAGLLESAGKAQQAQSQAELDVASQNWQDQWNYPLEQAAIKQAALSSSPYGTTSYGTGTQSGGSNTAGQVMGGISTAVGLLGLFA